MLLFFRAMALALAELRSENRPFPERVKGADNACH
jgi:hypothetical protein